jgi:hypothetical protein
MSWASSPASETAGLNEVLVFDRDAERLNDRMVSSD